MLPKAIFTHRVKKAYMHIYTPVETIEAVRRLAKENGVAQGEIVTRAVNALMSLDDRFRRQLTIPEED